LSRRGGKVETGGKDGKGEAGEAKAGKASEITGGLVEAGDRRPGRVCRMSKVVEYRRRKRRKGGNEERECRRGEGLCTVG
jgi:hypothetical protein